MEYIKNLALLLLTIIILLITSEGILSTGYFDGLDNPKAIWIPEKYKKLDREINLRNFDFPQRISSGLTTRTGRNKNLWALNIGSPY